jgi:hypothetical protein
MYQRACLSVSLLLLLPLLLLLLLEAWVVHVATACVGLQLPLNQLHVLIT